MLQETTGHWIIQHCTKKRQSSSSCVFIPEGARGLFPFNRCVFCAGVSRWTGCDSSFNQAANTDWTVTRARSAGTIYTLPVRLEPLTWDSNGSLDLCNQTKLERRRNCRLFYLQAEVQSETENVPVWTLYWYCLVYKSSQNSKQRK